MKIFNLTQYAVFKADKYINAHCGGKYTRKEAYEIGGIGVGGLRYVEGVDTISNIDTQERFRSNLETYKQGLGIYIRSLSYNYLLTIPSNDILAISLTKEEDKLKHAGFSFTKKLLSFGMPYHYASIMLLDQEIEEQHDTFLEITTNQGVIKLLVKRYNPYKVDYYFSNGPFSSLYRSGIKGFKYS